MAVTMNYGAAPTYVKIASQTLSSDTATVTFSNIPQGYTDLYLVSSARGSGHLYCRINGDSSALYSNTGIFFRRNDGNSADESGSEKNTGQTLVRLTPYTYLPNASLTFATNTANFMNYSNNSIFKTVLSRSSGTPSAQYVGVEQSVNLYRSTSPITSLTFGIQGGSNILSGTTFTIYGIKAAFVPKASGGDIIVQDGQYWYHAFRTTGVFVPRQALTADYLVVAGGGSGGSDGNNSYTAWGGGGAGGLRSATSQSLTTTSYTVTVGAGGSGGGGATNQGGNSGSNSSFNSLESAGGGGGANSWHANGSAGGSGGGGAGTYVLASTSGGAGNTPSTSPSQGNNGGGGSYGGSDQYAGGGGGGAGAVGGTTTNSNAGNGGAGSSAFSTWLFATNTGVSGYVAGGGGGASRIGTQGSGGLGGGTSGAGTSGSGAISANGTVNTGGGSGSAITAGNGGSGLVIVRYPV
jgi:hypothetical protein